MKTAFKHSESGPLLRTVSKLAGRAMLDYQMVEEGDRIAVAVSGGKDSLSLMHVLRDRQRVSPVSFELTAVHVDFALSGFNPDILLEYLNAQEFSVHIERSDYMKGETYEEIDCFWWSRNRRKVLFELANREGFTKIAFGHHLDDIVETIVLNQFYRGEIGAMKPKQTLFDGKITLIRPLAYVRERQMLELAQKLKIDRMGQSKCAHDDTSHRMKIKHMLREFEKDNPAIIKNIFNSLSNIRSDYLLEKEPHAA